MNKLRIGPYLKYVCIFAGVVMSVMEEVKYFLRMRRLCLQQVKKVDKILFELSKKYGLKIDFDNDSINV
jgi:hypothetical protein